MTPNEIQVYGLCPHCNCWSKGLHLNPLKKCLHLFCICPKTKCVFCGLKDKDRESLRRHERHCERNDWFDHWIGGPTEEDKKRMKRYPST